MPLTLRPATPADADADAVTALLTASYPSLMASAYEASTLERALPLMCQANPVLLASGRYWVAELDRQVLGCGGWTPERPGSGEVEAGLGHLRHFASHPDHLGRGIGRAIATACFEQAAGQGIARFEVYASLNAEGFYSALGFQVLEFLAIPMGPSLAFPSIRMRR